MSRNFYGVTIATIPTRELGMMLASARQHGIDVFVLAMGDPRLKMGWPRVYAVKTWELRDWLKRKLRSGVLKRNDMLVFTDGYDVLYQGGKADIMAGWRRAGSPDILFSAERFCWPDKALAPQFEHVSRGPYKYLNSGTFMGTAGALSAALQDPIFDAKENDKSDQLLWTQWFLKHRNTANVKLDVNQDVFACVAGDECLPLPRAPILHFNGPATPCLEKAWAALYPSLQTADPPPAKKTSLAAVDAGSAPTCPPAHGSGKYYAGMIAAATVAAAAVVVVVVLAALLARAKARA